VSVLEQQEFWQFVLIFLSVLAAIGGFFQKLTTLAVRFLEARRVHIRRKNIKGLVLTPSIEELARYSAPLPERHDVDEMLNSRAKKALNVQYLRELELYSYRRAEGRLLVLGILFFVGSIVIGFRFTLIQAGYF
jgi:hypothetical protein